jgi:hypothetical protein
MKLIIRLTATVLAMCAFGALAGETIKVGKVGGEKEQLVYSILKLAMSKVDPEAQFIETDESYNTARLASELESGSGNIDVMWAGAAKEMDDRLQAIRIPVLKGMLGHRIFIIRAEDQAKFSQIKSMADLKRFNAGQGTFWGDTKVLKNGGIPTITTIKYPNLFLMLEGGRFDYFPRALHEPWVEVKSRPELGLAIDTNVMLIYPYAMYFYVSKSNKSLHDKIYKGFEMAINDGSFDELFFNHPMIRDVLEQANLSKRTVIRIDNPFMHADTPNDRPEFWLDVKNL